MEPLCAILNRVIAGACLLALPLCAASQAFPTKPLRFVTQFAPGGSGDVSLRVLAPHMSQELGQPVIVENRPGGGGVVAAEIVARAAPDGHTVMSITSGTQIIRPFLSKSMPFDPFRDFTPITALYTSTTLLVAHPSAPGSMRDLIEYARRYPGKLSYGSAGIGTPDHLNGVHIAQLAGIDIVHVPYKASSLALTDAVSGQLQLTFTILAAASTQIKQGKVRALAVVGKRSAVVPDVPPLGEVIPGFQPVPSWNGIFGPAGLPKPVLDRLHGAIVKALNQPDSIARWKANGYETIGNTPEDFAAQIRQEYELVARMVKAAGIKPE